MNDSFSMSALTVKVEQRANGTGGNSLNYRDPNRWIFTAEELNTIPSRECGLDAGAELLERRKAAKFIEWMGKQLELPMLCINSAIIFMHRFFTLHSFTKVQKYDLATVAIFLAAKVEENPRKLVHVIRTAHRMIFPTVKCPEIDSIEFEERANILLDLENILLQTLGMDININHVHTDVVRGCFVIRTSKDVSRMAYDLATSCLMMTTMGLRYRASLLACVCILLASKMSKVALPMSKDGKEWWSYLDNDINEDQLKEIGKELFGVYTPRTTHNAEQ